ncbi:hypothetical protein CN500_31130 [Bacillus cereus]|nr:hypothetical protein CN500_31130 [Bacillus cereus]
MKSLKCIALTVDFMATKKEDYCSLRQDLERLSPYMTRHIKLFGHYVIDLQKIPHSIEETISL